MNHINLPLLPFALDRISPELLASLLLVAASAFFFAAALTLVLALRTQLLLAPRGTPAVTAGAPLTARTGAQARALADGMTPASSVGGEQRSAAAGAAPSDAAAATLPGADAARPRGSRDFAREIHLARQGSDARALMRECGLSQIEANLVVRMYGDPAKVNAGHPSPVAGCAGLSGNSLA
jgi:hypothetical protein